MVSVGYFPCYGGILSVYLRGQFLASPDAQEVMWVSESELADVTDVTLVSDDTFRRLGTWITHDHLSSVIESVRPS